MKNKSSIQHPASKILVIDDEQIIIDSVREDLRKENYIILSAMNGKEGLDIFWKEQPVLIILDLRMPVMDGIEFLERIKLKASDPYSVIVLTGHGDDENIEKCFGAGVSSFLSKPYNVHVLRGMVRHSIELTERTSELEISLREKEVLLKEVHHRVKNNMQVIVSLLRMQSRYVNDKQYIDMFKECQSRIESMSLVHEKLYQSKDLSNINFKDYVGDLARELFHSYGVDTGKIGLKIEVADVSLGVNTAIPCGLVINELISNSLKHAFPAGKDGEILIQLHLIDPVESRETGAKQFHRVDQNWIELIVSDTGVGMPENIDFRNTKSLGLQLITGIVENQLGGTIEAGRTEGTRIQIRFKET